MHAAGRLIAVVEDEDTIREPVCLALAREGHRTEAFDDGLRAWEAFERALPDLVLLDIGLPRMDGLELCRRLRARSERLPIVFVVSDRGPGIPPAHLDRIFDRFFTYRPGDHRAAGSTRAWGSQSRGRSSKARAGRLQRPIGTAAARRSKCAYR